MLHQEPTAASELVSIQWQLTLVQCAGACIFCCCQNGGQAVRRADRGQSRRADGGIWQARQNFRKEAALGRCGLQGEQHDKFSWVGSNPAQRMSACLSHIVLLCLSHAILARYGRWCYANEAIVQACSAACMWWRFSVRSHCTDECMEHRILRSLSLSPPLNTPSSVVCLVACDLFISLWEVVFPCRLPGLNHKAAGICRY